MEAAPGKGEPMSDHVVGCLAVAFRPCCYPGPLQFLLGFLGLLREGGHGPGPEEQPAHRPNHPAHDPSPVVMREIAPSPDLSPK
jgi:hypothetical protein